MLRTAYILPCRDALHSDIKPSTPSGSGTIKLKWNQVALTLPYSEHLGSTYRADTLSRWFAILHGYGFSVSNFSLGAAFHAVPLHRTPPSLY
jgi:hypothetical protein